MEEFKVLDINNDGSITLDEILQFLQMKVCLSFLNFKYEFFICI
jgi:Ca2+-binding EF-hand superfamily protein